MPGHAYLDLDFYAFWDQSWSNFHASMQTDNKSFSGRRRRLRRRRLRKSKKLDLMGFGVLLMFLSAFS